MNTSAVQYSSEPCWSRRCSIESILSIQGKETDFVRDSSDTETLSDGPVEYEPCTEDEDEGPTLGDSSGQSDNEIIATKVIAVSVGDDGDLEFADSEQTASDGSDSEVDLCDYWKCAQCGARNNNPLYRYCERCFKVRKSFFPPRPKRKHKRKFKGIEDSRPLSQDSGIESQEIVEPRALPADSEQPQTSGVRLTKNLDEHLTPDSAKTENHSKEDDTENVSSSENETAINDRLSKIRSRKRRAESADREIKRLRVGSESDDDSTRQNEVSPLVKTISDPSLTVEDVKVTKKVISDTLKEIDKDNNMCIVCLTEPKSGVFVHGRIAHICCCYKCAVKVWAKAKRCPVCNCKVSNVLRAVVM